MRSLKNTITQSELEDVAETIFGQTPKDSESIIFETAFGEISIIKDNLKFQHE